MDGGTQLGHSLTKKKLGRAENNILFPRWVFSIIAEGVGD
jgi:hypothetical protein